MYTTVVLASTKAASKQKVPLECDDQYVSPKCVVSDEIGLSKKMKSSGKLCKPDPKI